MLQVILYIAVSQDGFIADEQGGVGWLDKYSNIGEDYGYKEFYDSIDALVFGKNTYEQVLTFGPWPYPDKISYIFSDEQSTSQDNIQFVSGDIQEFLHKIGSKDIKRLWLMGGAQLTESFYKLGCIDEYILTILPDRLGSGIALPEPIFSAKNLELIKEIKYKDLNILQRYYRNKSTK